MAGLDVRLGGKLGEGRAGAPGDQALLQWDASGNSGRSLTDSERVW